MAVIEARFLPSLSRTRKSADSIAMDQGWQRESLCCDLKAVRLDVGDLLVQPCQFVCSLEDESLPAPPEVMGSVDPEAFSSETLTELRLRLLVIGMLGVLVQDDESPETVCAALAFIKDFGGKNAIPRSLMIWEPELFEDFIAWCDCGQDLAIWFAKRFVASRLLAA